VLVDTAALMLSPGRGLEAGVDVAADGSGWTAAWTSADSAAASVRCATLSLSGHIADTLAVWSRGTPEAVRVVGLGQGRSLVVYSAAAETLRGRPSGARRIWAADIYSTAGLAGRQVCQREGLSVGPNPAAGDVRIEFAVRPAGRVLLRLYDASGREVRTLCDAVSQAGDRSFIWSGRDDAGRVCPQGIYFLQLQTDSYRSRKKVVLAR
jgi:hypothetical protein